MKEKLFLVRSQTDFCFHPARPVPDTPRLVSGWVKMCNFIFGHSLGTPSRIIPIKLEAHITNNHEREIFHTISLVDSGIT